MRVISVGRVAVKIEVALVPDGLDCANCEPEANVMEAVLISVGVGFAVFFVGALVAEFLDRHYSKKN